MKIILNEIPKHITNIELKNNDLKELPEEKGKAILDALPNHVKTATIGLSSFVLENYRYFENLTQNPENLYELLNKINKNKKFLNIGGTQYINLDIYRQRRDLLDRREGFNESVHNFENDSTVKSQTYIADAEIFSTKLRKAKMNFLFGGDPLYFQEQCNEAMVSAQQSTLANHPGIGGFF